MKFILGKKIEMSQRYKDENTVAPVTLVQAGPCVISQIKSLDKDKYQAVQVEFEKHKREFKVTGDWKKGDQLTLAQFKVGDKVKITGTNKGKGFQGVVKRHGFHGSPATHGHKDQLRKPGSLGAGGVQKVFKGLRMGGHMGNVQVSVLNLEIIAIEPEKNLIYVQGAVPGSRNGLLMIQAND